MDFNEKLQQLRTKSGLTQEQLAEKVFVSRVAVAKWESGRGYPNLDSLKSLAKIFNISIDDLLSSEELIDIAEVHTKNKGKILRTLVLGITDVMAGNPSGIEPTTIVTIDNKSVGISYMLNNTPKPNNKTATNTIA